MNKEIIKHEIGQRITEIRKQMHMSKKEFSELIGIKQQYLGNVESGKKGLTIEKVIEICNKTEVSADYLLLGVNNTFETLIKDNFSKYSDEQIKNAFEIMENTITLFNAKSLAI